MSEKPLQASTVALAAEKLQISSRSLARYLSHERTTFGELLERVREARSKVLLEQGTSVDEIAVQLGFSQGTSFHRAFKRWTGETPGDYRTAHGRADLF